MDKLIELLRAMLPVRPNETKVVYTAPSFYAEEDRVQVWDVGIQVQDVSFGATCGASKPEESVSVLAQVRCPPLPDGSRDPNPPSTDACVGALREAAIEKARPIRDRWAANLAALEAIVLNTMDPPQG